MGEAVGLVNFGFSEALKLSHEILVSSQRNMVFMKFLLYWLHPVWREWNLNGKKYRVGLFCTLCRITH